jgi:hypothetical protein
MRRNEELGGMRSEKKRNELSPVGLELEVCHTNLDGVSLFQQSFL